MWQERGYNGDSLWIWGVAAPYGDSTMIEEFIDSTGVTFPLIETTSGDSLITLYEVTYTPRYFAICPDHSMKGFNYGAEENIFIFIDNCELSANNLEIKNKIPATFYANKLHILSNLDDDVLIYVSNSLGQQIKIINCKLNKGNNIIDLDINKGFYLVNIFSNKNKQTTTLKIIISKN